MVYRWNFIDEPFRIAGPNPPLTEFGIHPRLEGCVLYLVSLVPWMIVTVTAGRLGKLQSSNHIKLDFLGQGSQNISMSIQITYPLKEKI